MNIEKINKKIANIYEKLKNPKYIIKGWVIVEPEEYEKTKNKLLIKNINNIIVEQINKEDVISIICESKDKFYYIKYNSQFVGVVESNTEYGLILNSYNIYAVNSEVFNTLPPFDKNKLDITGIFNLLSWKLSKKSKEYLSNFD